MPRFLKIGNVRYLNLDAIAEVRLNGEMAVITLISGHVLDVPLDLAGDLLAWCEGMATYTQHDLFGEAPTAAWPPYASGR